MLPGRKYSTHNTKHDRTTYNMMNVGQEDRGPSVRKMMQRPQRFCPPRFVSSSPRSALDQSASIESLNSARSRPWERSRGRTLVPPSCHRPEPLLIRALPLSALAVTRPLPTACLTRAGALSTECRFARKRVLSADRRIKRRAKTGPTHQRTLDSFGTLSCGRIRVPSVPSLCCPCFSHSPQLILTAERRPRHPRTGSFSQFLATERSTLRSLLYLIAHYLLPPACSSLQRPLTPLPHLPHHTIVIRSGKVRDRFTTARTPACFTFGVSSTALLTAIHWSPFLHTRQSTYHIDITQHAVSPADRRHDGCRPRIPLEPAFGRLQAGPARACPQHEV